jgi:metal-dependent amidase/aminoacylase/carboxypeptidase family protein
MVTTKSDIEGVSATPFLAYKRWSIEYFGKATHASSCPWDGINAYDAAVAAHVNIGLLRQQILPLQRIHGCMVEGPKVVNVIADYTKLNYIARSTTRQTLDVLETKVLRCFQAAAEATGCKVKINE